MQLRAYNPVVWSFFGRGERAHTTRLMGRREGVVKAFQRGDRAGRCTLHFAPSVDPDEGHSLWVYERATEIPYGLVGGSVEWQWLCCGFELFSCR